VRDIADVTIEQTVVSDADVVSDGSEDRTSGKPGDGLKNLMSNPGVLPGDIGLGENCV